MNDYIDSKYHLIGTFQQFEHELCMIVLNAITDIFKCLCFIMYIEIYEV